MYEIRWKQNKGKVSEYHFWVEGGRLRSLNLGLLTIFAFENEFKLIILNGL